MSESRYPSLYQINTRVALTSLSQKIRRTATLDDWPEAELDKLAHLGFNWIWLLGVWQTGEAGRSVSLSHPSWRGDFEHTLPKLQDSDIGGSCFAIQNYLVAESIGGGAALARFREKIHQRGMRLMLDFVPNHMAMDHPWVVEHPDYFVKGTDENLQTAPQNYIQLNGMIFAYGRDPYFDGWPDTFQLNYGNPALQEAMRQQLERIAEQCDGVRCDMAMLIEPDVFERTWRLWSEPFWSETIQRVRKRVPNFLFLAEVYWDMEWTLLQQGFDFAYDKRLYDRLKDGGAATVRDHLCAGIEYQNHLARFLENHDEERAASVFSFERHCAAAIITYLSPGLRFFHQGQLDGFIKRISPHLSRGPEETGDVRLKTFYNELLTHLHSSVFRNGNWQQLEAIPVEDDSEGCRQILISAWTEEEGRYWLAAVNFAPSAGKCMISLPISNAGDDSSRMKSWTGTMVAHCLMLEVDTSSLLLDFQPWGYALIEFIL